MSIRQYNKIKRKMWCMNLFFLSCMLFATCGARRSETFSIPSRRRKIFQRITIHEKQMCDMLSLQMIHAVNQITKTNDDYAFTVYGNQGKVSKLVNHVNVGGIDVPVVIDSGATVNIIDTLRALKKNKIKCESKTSSKNLYAYGCNKPLTIAGSFNTNV